VRVRPPGYRDGEGEAERQGSSSRWRISDRRLGLIYAVLAAVAWSTAGILQRQLHVNAATQVAGRGVFGFLTLAGYAAYTQANPLASVTRRGALLAAGAMAVANSAFIVSLNYATVAHVLVLQSIAPLVAAGLGVVVLGEKLTWRTACAMAVALGGVIVMVGAPGGGPVVGDALSLLTGAAFALVIVVARRYRGVSMAPAMALAQLLVVIVFGPFAQWSHLSWADVGWLALLGCGQIGLGAIFFISAARFVPSSEMAMIFLLEVVLGPLWTWIALSETPNVATLVGGAAVILGVGAQVGGFGKQEGSPTVSDAELPPRLGASARLRRYLRGQRTWRKNSRTSPISRSGASRAAKWPPRPNSVQCTTLWSRSARGCRVVSPGNTATPVGTGDFGLALPQALAPS
jgi:drug/metabolite transporter (DMT)-like permease